MVSILLLINMILGLYSWVIIFSAVLSWLIAFNVVNTRNPIVTSLIDFLYRVTEPVMRPFRRIIPNLGGLDLSPIAVLLAIWLIQDINARYLIPAVSHAGL